MASRAWERLVHKTVIGNMKVISIAVKMIQNPVNILGWGQV